MYATDNGGKLINGAGGEIQGATTQWVSVMVNQYKNVKMRTCPMAYKFQRSREGGTLNEVSPFVSWGMFSDGTYGSYGMNEFTYNRDASTVGGEYANYWRTIYVKPANMIPAFLDCYWYDVWPHDADVPPANINDVAGPGMGLEMKRVCLDRHNQAVNCTFIDWSIRKVGLKELWTLKWHRNFNTANHWTKAGGATVDQWPQWMQGFKDY
jgi:hypothetical protein